MDGVDIRAYDSSVCTISLPAKVVQLTMSNENTLNHINHILLLGIALLIRGYHEPNQLTVYTGTVLVMLAAGMHIVKSISDES